MENINSLPCGIPESFLLLLLVVGGTHLLRRRHVSGKCVTRLLDIHEMVASSGVELLRIEG